MNQQQISKVRYTHDAMIDLVIADPSISQNKIAEVFGYRPHTISIIFNSDAFQERLANRRAELIDPAITASIEEKLKAVADTSLTQILKQLHDNPNDMELSIEAAKVATKAMGYGAKVQTQHNTSFVVQLPPRQPDSAAWAAAYQPAPVEPVTIENGSSS